MYQSCTNFVPIGDTNMAVTVGMSKDGIAKVCWKIGDCVVNGDSHIETSRQSRRCAPWSDGSRCLSDIYGYFLYQFLGFVPILFHPEELKRQDSPHLPCGYSNTGVFIRRKR